MSEASPQPDFTRTLAIAYVLALVLGGLGAHRFYLNEKGTATALLLVTLSSVALMVVAVGFFTIWISIVWVLADLFLMPGLARRALGR